MNKSLLKKIGTTILNSSTIQQEIEAAQELSTFFVHHDDAISKKRASETTIKGGVALSLNDAALCAEDYLRTARFIKGTYNAIQELYKRFPEQKINILYAGCGPYATILLPILPLLDHNKIEIILIDIHEDSIHSVNRLISSLEVNDFFAKVICINALNYTAPTNWPMHLLISETMFHALIREPQVAITCHLAPQLTKNGILIPEKIRIDLVKSFYSKLPYLKNASSILNLTNKNDNITIIKTLFEINKSTGTNDIFCQNTEAFKSEIFIRPEYDESQPDLCLLTHIQIFNDQILNLAESFITNPYCLTSLLNLTNNSKFRIHYNYSKVPEWYYESINEQS